MLGGGGGTLWEDGFTKGVLEGAGTHPNVLAPEEELTAEVGALHMVHVSHSHAPSASEPQADKGKAFEQLAADGTSAHLPAGAALAREPGPALP